MPVLTKLFCLFAIVDHDSCAQSQKLIANCTEIETMIFYILLSKKNSLEIFK